MHDMSPNRQTKLTLTVKSTPFKQNSSNIDSMKPSRNDPLPAGATTWSGAFRQGNSPATFLASSADAAVADADAASPGVLPALKARLAAWLATGAGDNSQDDGDDTRPCARSERFPGTYMKSATTRLPGIRDGRAFQIESATLRYAPDHPMTRFGWVFDSHRGEWTRQDRSAWYEGASGVRQPPSGCGAIVHESSSSIGGVISRHGNYTPFDDAQQGPRASETCIHARKTRAGIQAGAVDNSLKAVASHSSLYRDVSQGRRDSLRAPRRKTQTNTSALCPLPSLLSTPQQLRQSAKRTNLEENSRAPNA